MILARPALFNVSKMKQLGAVRRQAYIMASVCGLLLFSFTGSGFEESIADTIGSLTNAGNLIALEGLGSNELRQLWLMLGMILGRLEVLAFVPLLTASFWRR